MNKYSNHPFQIIKWASQVFGCLLFSFISNPMKADVIPDANTAILGKILVQGIQEVKNLEDTYSKVVEFTNLAEQTKNGISDLLKLQNDFKAALLVAKNIKDLKFSDLLSLVKRNTNFQTLPSDYLSEGSGFLKILNSMGNNNLNPNLGSDFYQAYHSPSGTLINGSGNNIFDQLEMDNYLADQKGKSYQNLNLMADKLEEKALEIESMITTDNIFSMNSAERMGLILKGADDADKAAKLRIEANQILESRPGMFLQAENKVLELLRIQRGFSSRIQFSQQYSNTIFN